MSYNVNVISAHASFGKGGQTTIGAQGTFTYKLTSNDSVLARFEYESGRRGGRHKKPSHTLKILSSTVYGALSPDERAKIAETIKQTAKSAVRAQVVEFLRQRECDLI